MTPTPKPAVALLIPGQVHRAECGFCAFQMSAARQDHLELHFADHALFKHQHEDHFELVGLSVLEIPRQVAL